MRHLGEQRIGERRLARAGAARDENITALDHRQRQQPIRPTEETSRRTAVEDSSPGRA